MIKICAHCGQPKEAYVHTAEGWLCHDSVLSASTVIQTLYIDGQRFHVCLKGVPPKTQTPARSVAGAVSPFTRKGE